MRVNVLEHLQETLLFAQAGAYAQDERVGKELFGTGSLVWVLFEAAVQEVAHVGGSTRDVFRRFAGNHNHCDDGLHPQVTRLSLAKLDKDDPKRPNIHTFRVLLFSNQFRRHPGRCSGQLLGGSLFLGELQRIPEISNLNLPIPIDKNVITL